MKKLLLKQRKGKKVKIPKIVFKLADMSPEERKRRLDDVYDIIFGEALKNLNK